MKTMKAKRTRQNGNVMPDDVIIAELSQTSGIIVNRMRKLFTALDPASFTRLARRIEKSKNTELTGQFIYYLTLFRYENTVRQNIRDADFPLSILEYLIISVYTHAVCHGMDERRLLTSLLQLLDGDILVALIRDSKYISSDPALYAFLASFLSRQYIDELFNSHSDLQGFLAGLASLPRQTQMDIFSRNTELYGYVSLFLPVYGFENVIKNETNEESITLNESDTAVKVAAEVYSLYDVENDSRTDLHLRDRNRFAHIVKCAKESGSAIAFLDELMSRGAIIDSLERSLLEEILYNPILKPVLLKYVAVRTDNYN
ncbi:MAG: hypothetical protein ACOCWH_04805 [Spirochaetota bacterium]